MASFNHTTMINCDAYIIINRLTFADGDQIVMRVVDGELYLRPARDVLRRVQELLQPYVIPDGSVADELIAERRAEAARG